MLQPSADREPESAEAEDEDICAHCGRAGLLEAAMEDEAPSEDEGEEPEPDKEKDKAAFIEALKRKSR
jgi:hypothetical protein